MTGRAAGSGLFVTAASGGGAVANAGQLRALDLTTGQPVSSASGGELVTFRDSYWKDHGLPINDVEFPDFGGGKELLVAWDTGGWARLRRTVGYSPLSDPKLIEDCTDGSPRAIACMPDNSAAAASKRVWLAQGRKRCALRVSDSNRVDSEDRENFAVTGTDSREEPAGLAVDSTNLLLWTVTKQGGVYCDDITTQSAPVQAAAPISLRSYFATGELVVDVAVWTAPGEEITVVLTTHHVYTVSKTATVLAVEGVSEIVTPGGLKDANPVSADSVNSLLVAILDHLVVFKDDDGLLVAAVAAQCRAYDTTRPFAQVIVLCNLDLAGGYASPRFTSSSAPYCVFYNPFPVAPSGWAAYKVSNPTATKADFTVAGMWYAEGGGAKYVYVAHGRMRQVIRLDVSAAFSGGIGVGAIIPCGVGYTTDPATNTSLHFTQAVVDPANYERFVAYEEGKQSIAAGARMVVLNAGLETVASSNVLTLTRFVGTLRPAVTKLAATTFSIWNLDSRTQAFTQRAINGDAATPTVLFEKYMSKSCDGCAFIESIPVLYMLTFGGVVPYKRLTSADQFFPKAAGYQPSRSLIGGQWDEHNTEQVDVGLDVNGVGDHRVFTVSGLGGFFEYKVTLATGFLGAARFFPKPTHYATDPAFPGWDPADGYYANDIQYRVIDGVPCILSDITNYTRQEHALMGWVYDSGGDTWNFTAVAIATTSYSGIQADHLTLNLHITKDLTGRTFAMVTFRSGFHVFRIDRLVSDSEITLIESHETDALFDDVKGIATSFGRVFVLYYGPGGDLTRGQLRLYDFDTLSGEVDIDNPLQIIDSSSLDLPTGHAWKTSYNVRFLQLDAGTGAGGVYVCSGEGTLIELEYDPAAAGTASATFYANVQTNGFSAEVQWRYRKIGDSASQVTGFATLPGTTPSGVLSLTVAGLLAGTDYEVQASGQHTDGPFAGDPVVGEWVAFTTPGENQNSPFPQAATAPATNIGGTTATLNARVNPNGSATLAHFAYSGPNGQVVSADIDCGSGFTFVPISLDVSALDPDADYAVQVVASNAAGHTVSGNTLLFHTLPLAAAPQIESVTVPLISATGARVHVDLDTGLLACRLTLEYGTTTAYGLSKILTIAGAATFANVTLDDLAAGTDYHVKAHLTNALGVAVSGDVQFTTGAAGNDPTGDTALPDGIRPQFATLHALIDPNTETTTVTFEYWRADDPSNVFTLAADATSAAAGPTDFSARATALAQYTEYVYRALASNASGSIAGQAIHFKTAGGASGAKLTLITSPTAEFVTENSATVIGSVARDAIASTFYFEYWITGQNKRFSQSVFIDSGAGPASEIATGLLSGLTSDATYNYRLCGVSAADPAIQYGSTFTFTTLPASTTPPATGIVNQVIAASSSALTATGLLNTNGEDTDIVFQASLSSTFAVIAASSPLETVSDPNQPTLEHQGALTGLANATAYFVRLQMTHRNGPVVSYSLPFGPVSTLAATPPSVTTLPLSSPTSGTIEARSSVTVPTNVGQGPTFAWFEYGRFSRPSGTGYEVVGPEMNLGSSPGSVFAALTMGGPNTPAPLIPATQYFCRAFARNSIGTVMGAEVQDSTLGGGSPNDPAPVATGIKNATPHHFDMTGTLLTNGSDTEVEFQYVLASDVDGWDSANVIVRTQQVIDDVSRLVLVADHTDFIPAPANWTDPALRTWLWRISAKHNLGNPVYAYGSPVVLPVPVPNPTYPLAVVSAQTNRLCLDAESVRLGFDLNHNGVRTWTRMEWGTDPLLATYTKSRWVSFIGPKPGAVGTGQGTMHYADYLDGLAKNTTYYYRLRCWSVEGEHTGPSSSFVTAGNSADGPGGKYALDWAASVGLAPTARRTARGMRGPIPQNLRTGAGALDDPEAEVVWIDDSGTLDYSTAEDAYTILVSPTRVDIRYGLPSTRNDSPSYPNLCYALRNARVGDKIRMEGGHQMLAGRYATLSGAPFAVGSTVAGVSTFGTASQWTAMVHRLVTGGNAHFGLRLLTGTMPSSFATQFPGGDPTFENIQQVAGGVLTGTVMSGVALYYAGDYVYECPDLGGKGSFQATPPTSTAYWSGVVGRYPITGVRILPKTPSTQRFSLGGTNLGNADGGFNGLFFRFVDITQLFAGNRECWLAEGGKGYGGCGVLGLSDFTFKQYDAPGYGGAGVKQQLRAEGSITRRFHRGTFSPAQEHFMYVNSEGDINPQRACVVDVHPAGFTPDGRTTVGGRSFNQSVARGEATAHPGQPPGVSTLDILRCSYLGPSGDSASLSIYGHFGTVNITEYAHHSISAPTQADTRQSFVLQDDNEDKGMWLNERGFQTDEINIDLYSCDVTNEEDSFVKVRGVERLNIGRFSLTGSNRKPIFNFLANALNDNGLVTFTGAGISPDALLNYVGWPATVPVGSRIVHANVGILTPAQFQEYQDGKQFLAIF